MLRKYKNQLPAFFEELKFEGSDFDFSENGINFTITYKEGPMKFSIYQNDKDFNSFTFSHTKFSPDFSTSSFNRGYLAFNEILSQLKKWCNDHLEQYSFEKYGPDELDNWTKQNMGFINVENLDFHNEEPFSLIEKEQIKSGFEEIRELIVSQFELSNKQTAELNQTIDYLKKMSERLANKTDWKHLLIGALFSLTISLALDTEKTKAIWLIFKNVLNTISDLKGFFLPD